MTLNELISAVKISPADKKTLADVSAEYQSISDLGVQMSVPGDFHPNRLTCPLHTAVDQSLAALEASPTIENAEAVHQAIVRESQAHLSHEVIQNVLHHGLVRTSAKLKPVALRILDDCEKSARETHAKQRQALIDAAVDSKLIAQHDAQLSAIIGKIEGERGSVESCALNFCQRFALA